jgi:hypothetical protein
LQHLVSLALGLKGDWRFNFLTGDTAGPSILLFGSAVFIYILLATFGAFRISASLQTVLVAEHPLIELVLDLLPVIV